MNIQQIANLINIQISDQPEPDVLEQLERRPDRFTRDGEIIRGAVISHFLNASIILDSDSRMMNRFSYNEFNDQIYVNGGAIEDQDITEITLWIHRVYGVRIGKDPALDLIIRQAKINTFHPLRDYLDNLPSWDGEVRLDNLLQRYWGAKETPLLCEIGKRWAISCIARALESGCKVDTVLILCGPQGCLKSTSFRVLAGESWFSDSHLDISKKEAYELIHQSGVWLWEMAEIMTLQRANNENQKMFLSASSDRYRPSYGRCPVQKGRSVVFVGTTNEATFLTDGTGNRRYWPVNVGTIDLEAIQRDRDQIWAEALFMYSQNENWWLDVEQDVELIEYQKTFVVEDPWFVAVEECINIYENGFLVQDVFERLQLPEHRQTKKDIKRVHNICRGLGLRLKRLSRPLIHRPSIDRPRAWIC